MNKLNVELDLGKVCHSVGELFFSEKLKRYLFNYDPLFAATRLELSPYALPLSKNSFIAEINKDFYNLPPLFAESLPDAWGKKIQDLEFEKINIVSPSALERLSFVGNHGMGALRYHPEQKFSSGINCAGLGELRKAAQNILSGDINHVVDELLMLGGSVGGARPKFLIDLNKNNFNEIRYTKDTISENWVPCIIKISNVEYDHWQRIEYTYFKMAESANITVPQTWLLEESDTRAHFVIERFDRNSAGDKFHMQSFAGLLGVNFHDVTLDYSRLLRMTSDLCRDKKQVEEIFRRMIFNFLGSNKDDHGKNISFLMDKTGRWSLSPAYDLSFSTGEHGLHAMSLNGKRRNAIRKDFETIAENFDIVRPIKIMDEVVEALLLWRKKASENKVPEKYINIISERLSENLNRLG